MDFHWQSGYGCFSASGNDLSDLIRYIDNQLVHHARAAYKDEFVKLCKDHGLEYDERYVWD